MEDFPANASSPMVLADQSGMWFKDKLMVPFNTEESPKQPGKSKMESWSRFRTSMWQM
jgi:hypothetical protein